MKHRDCIPVEIKIKKGMVTYLMQQILRFFLFSSRKRRCLVVGVILWLLRQVSDVEKDEMWRYSDMLDSFEPEHNNILRRGYSAIEEEYSSCEYAVCALESVIEELECAY